MRTVQELTRCDPGTLSVEELERILHAEEKGGVFPGELPIHLEIDRQRCLDSPSYFVRHLVDEWYDRHLEPIHDVLLDKVMGPYLTGDTVEFAGSQYDPRQYTGLLVLFSRGTLKSTLLRWMLVWDAIYRYYRLGEDARTMFCHQVLEKAIEHSESVRTFARQHEGFRARFPEFRANPSGEWDTKGKWRWPAFKNYKATEWSWTCYGETSNKIGGHYTVRGADDWVTDESVTTPQQIEQSKFRFDAMDNLRDRSRPYNPWLAMGTHYHYQDTYKHLENKGGWLVWKVPAHTGSPKRIFDLCSVTDRSQHGRNLIEGGLKRLESDPPGQLNFPGLLDWRELYRSARSQGPHQYNCQLLLDPVPEGEQRFDLQAIEEGLTDELFGPGESWMYVRVDPAISKKREADETAIVCGLVSWDARRQLADGWVGRENRPTEIVRKSFTFARKWQSKGYRVVSIGFESVAYQEALAEMARGGVPEREAKHHGESVPVLMRPCAVRSIRRSPELRKQERILEMDGPITRRELSFWRHCPITERAMQQLKNFPHDRFDILDALHDLWEQVRTPPPPEQRSDSPFPKEFEKYMKKRFDGQPKLVGTNNQVRLASWG